MIDVVDGGKQVTAIRCNCLFGYSWYVSELVGTPVILADSLYEACLQEIIAVVFITLDWIFRFEEYNYLCTSSYFQLFSRQNPHLFG